MKKTRFLEPKDVPLSTYRERRRSSSNDRTLNPSISGAEQDSLCSTQEIHDNPRYLSRRSQERYSGGIHEETAISKTIVAKGSNIAKSLRRTPTKASNPPKRCDSVRSVGISLSHSLYTHMHVMILEV
jgi:NIMA (never in mitosis gene a)-related kinase